MRHGVKYESWRIESEAQRERLLHAQREARIDLPLRWWRQSVHLTVPAGDLAVATKAVQGGVPAAERILARWSIDRDALAATFAVPRAHVDAALDAFDRRAPLVMIDGEDAQAPDAASIERGRENAVTLFRTGDWGSSLRFWRPAGIDRVEGIDDLGEVIAGAVKDQAPGFLPIDGITWPKAHSVAELEWLTNRLSAIEDAFDLPNGRIRVQLMVESGAAVEGIENLVRAVGKRLTGLIYGIADHAADVGLHIVDNAHPLADWARLRIVNAAGLAGVPAIDSMSLHYPVPEAGLDAAANRALLLSRMKECFDDATHGFSLGMTGKWVGHPLQLVAVLVAAEALLPASRIEEEVSRIEAYRAAQATGRGATIIDGEMNDRAHDRQARTLLRRAAAMGRLELARARTLGIVGADETA